METHSVSAVVLAGGRRVDPVARSLGLPHKALAPVAGEPVLLRVLRALEQARSVQGVVVATECRAVEALVGARARLARPAGPQFVDTIAAGLAALPEADRVLLVTCDLPLLRAEAVEDFVARALDSEAELCYSMVNGERLAELPGVPARLLIPLQEGRFTGGNLTLLSRRLFEQQRERVRQAFAARKHPVRLAQLLGLGFVWRLLWRRLSVADVVARAHRLLGAPATVVDSAYVDVCMDLDKPRHLAQAEEALAAGWGTSRAEG